MRIRPDQLPGALAKDLLPVYLVSGDEPLQLGEAADAIREHARRQGYTGREVMTVEPGFDWSALGASASAMSLFAEQRLIELRLPTGKPGDTGAKELVAYAGNPPPDAVLLIVAGKLDKAQQNTKWFKALDQVGAVVQVWPVEPARLPAWLTQRMRAKGLRPDPAAVALLAERVEGNLLAASQEIEKLCLLYDQGTLDAAQVAASVADSARYDIFGLVDAAVSGDAAHAARQLRGLRMEGAEPVLVLWALTRALRELSALAADLEQGIGMDHAFAKHKVWDKRKAPVGAALRRAPKRRWEALLVQAGRVDRVIKGALPGNPWDDLLQLTLALAGIRLFSAA